MTTSLVFVLIALALLLSFTYLATRRSASLPNLEQALIALRSLDIDAFRNLVDPQEEEHLRSCLPAREFRTIQRERTLVALAYVKELSRVSLQFAHFGSAAQRSPDPAVAASGKKIANSAIYLRLRALDATVQLVFLAAFPGRGPRGLRPLLDNYDRASHLLVRHNDAAKARVFNHSLRAG